MIVRRIARPMLASIFVFGGINALRHAGAHTPAAEPVAKEIAAPLGLPGATELPVRVNGAAMVGGGALLASTLLAASLVPTTATHQFWNESDPEAKQMQQVQFFKNVSLLGGLLLAAADTAGKPGLPYRAKLATENVERSARQARKAARREAKLAALQAKNAGR